MRTKALLHTPSGPAAASSAPACLIQQLGSRRGADAATRPQRPPPAACERRRSNQLPLAADRQDALLTSPCRFVLPCVQGRPAP